MRFIGIIGLDQNQKQSKKKGGKKMKEEKKIKFESKEEERLFMSIRKQVKQTIEPIIENVCKKFNLRLERKGEWDIELKSGIEFITKINLAKVILNMATMIVKDPEGPYIVVNSNAVEDNKEFKKECRENFTEYILKQVIPLVSSKSLSQEGFKKKISENTKIKWFE